MQMSFLEASPANPSVKPATGVVLPTSVTSGLKHIALSGSLDRDVSLLRMCWEQVQAALSTRYAVTWKLKPTPAGRFSFQLAYLVRPMNVSDFSLWPTPSASDTKAREPSMSLHVTRNGTFRHINKAGGQSQVRLSQVVKLWGTPTANNVHTSTLPPSEAKRGSLVGDLIRQGETGRLNPDWVELLMGLPVGWTDLTRSSTFRAGRRDKGVISIPTSRRAQWWIRRRTTMRVSGHSATA